MTAIDERLLTYLAARDKERLEAVSAAFLRLTDRERGLVKDAAVMGFVQGNRWGPYDSRREDEFPKDAAIVRMTFDGIRAYPDLYPAIAALFGDDANYTSTSGVVITPTRHGTWVWRCEGVGDCEGAMGTGLHTVTAAVREADRHVTENHPAVEVTA